MTELQSSDGVAVLSHLSSAKEVAAGFIGEEKSVLLNRISSGCITHEGLLALPRCAFRADNEDCVLIAVRIEREKQTITGEK